MIWLDPQPCGDRLAGQVEHVATARHEHFSEAQALLRFLTEASATLPKDGGDPAPDPARRAHPAPLSRSPP